MGFSEVRTSVERYCSFIPPSMIKLSEQEVIISFAQHIIIKLLALESVKRSEILDDWKPISKRDQFQELECLRGNLWRVESTSRTRDIWPNPHENHNIRYVQQLLEGNRYLMDIETAEEVGISYDSTSSIISEKPVFRKVCARGFSVFWPLSKN